MTITDTPDDAPAPEVRPWSPDPWDRVEFTDLEFTEEPRRQRRVVQWVVYGAMVLGVVALIVLGGHDGPLRWGGICDLAPQFDVDAFLSQGFADFGQGRQVQLRLRVSATVATHLAECRLSEDQRITRLNTPPGWCRISATVNDTPQLRWWIRGFGAEVVAESPILA